MFTQPQCLGVGPFQPLTQTCSCERHACWCEHCPLCGSEDFESCRHHDTFFIEIFAENGADVNAFSDALRRRLVNENPLWIVVGWGELIRVVSASPQLSIGMIRAAWDSVPNHDHFSADVSIAFDCDHDQQLEFTL